MPENVSHWQDKIQNAICDTVPIIFVMGATATGKTDVAALMSNNMPAELISVDSSLVYRGMDIGTAKPDQTFLTQYPHHLIDIRNPDQTYSAADFCQDAKKLITEIIARGNMPILVGGTSFYFSALANGLPDLPEKNPHIRQQLEQEAAEKGWPAMHHELQKLDPQSAQRIHVNDPQRIQRALEINVLTGRPVADKTSSKPLIKNPIVKIAVYHNDRKKLHRRIERRFELMMKQGLDKEIDGLLQQYSKEIPAFRMIGYRQFIQGKESQETLDSINEKSIIATRQLAKRQLTWLRNQSGVLWQNINKKNLAKSSVFLAQYSLFRLQNIMRF